MWISFQTIFDHCFRSESMVCYSRLLDKCEEVYRTCSGAGRGINASASKVLSSALAQNLGGIHVVLRFHVVSSG